MTLSVFTGAEALQIVNNIIELADKAVQTIQEETTERERITEEARVAIARIKSQERLLTAYLERSFDERGEVFKKLFAQLDRAFEEGPAQVEAVLGAINKLAAKSPFADLRNVDDVRRMWGDTEGEIEI